MTCPDRRAPSPVHPRRLPVSRFVAGVGQGRHPPAQRVRPLRRAAGAASSSPFGPAPTRASLQQKIGASWRDADRHRGGRSLLGALRRPGPAERASRRARSRPCLGFVRHDVATWACRSSSPFLGRSAPPCPRRSRPFLHNVPGDPLTCHSLDQPISSPPAAASGNSGGRPSRGRAQGRR